MPLSEPVSYHVKQKLTRVLSVFHATPVKCTHNGFLSDLLKWALKRRFYATGPRPLNVPKTRKQNFHTKLINYSYRLFIQQGNYKTLYEKYSLLTKFFDWQFFTQTEKKALNSVFSCVVILWSLTQRFLIRDGTNAVNEESEERKKVATVSS